MTVLASRDGAVRRAFVDDVDCCCCGRWFGSFDALCAHVKRQNKRFGKRKVSQAIDTYLAQWRDARMKLPKPARQAQQDALPEFLKAQHVGKVGARGKLTISGAPRLATSQYGEQLVIPVKLGKTAYDFAVRLATPNYALLFDQFGDKTEKWKGTINVIVLDGARNPYLAIESN